MLNRMTCPMSTRSDQPLIDAGADAYDAGEFDLSAEKFSEALASGEDPVKAWTNLAAAQRALGRAPTAAAMAARSVALDPANAEGWGVLGAAHLSMDRFEEAAHALRAAIAHDPDEARYHGSLGIALHRAARIEAALAAYERAASLAPDTAKFHFQWATALLHLERYEEAWPLYEHRFEASGISHRAFETAPLWDGAPLAGRKLMIYAEQGLGDALQFARFLPTALKRAGEGEVTVEALPPLIRLFRQSFPDVRVMSCNEDPPPFDVRLPFTSIPGLFGLAPETGLRPDGGYLIRPRVSAARSRPRVGLVWKGNRIPWDRSCPFPVFLGLTEIAGIDFVSLQRGGADDIAEAGAQALIEDPTGDLEDFLDDAHIAADLDLVISVDTSTCHFAGALDLPVWCLLGPYTDWRFPPAGDRTRWYPTMRLFRMAQGGRWTDVIAEAAAALKKHFAKGDGPSTGVGKSR